MAQVQCKKGHYYNDEIYPKCPYCDGDDGSNDDADNNSKKGVIVKILAALAVVLALGSFAYANSKETKLEETRKEFQTKSAELDSKKKELADKDIDPRTINSYYRFFNAVFGYGSEKFYAETPILVLEAGGAAKDIVIKCDYEKEKESFIAMGGFTKEEFNSGLLDDIQAEWINNNIRVTPGSKKGFNVIHVLIEGHEESFDVLVIVK